MKTPKIAKQQKKRVDAGRDRAASVLDRASDAVRSGSHKAAELIDRGGEKTAGALHTSAERVQPGSSASRHPRRSAMFVAFAALTLLVAFLIVRSQLSGDDDDDDDDFDF